MSRRRPHLAAALAAQLVVLGPASGVAAAAAAATPPDLATCPAGKQLQRTVKKTTKRGRVRRTVRWRCVVDRRAPTRVTGIFAVAGDGRVVLTWRASEDAGGIAGYEIYRDGRYVTTITATTFTDPSLANGVAHQYRVFAVDMARNLSRPSGVVWAMPRELPDRTAPGMPLGLAATADPTALTVTLRWTAPSDDKGVVGYRVYRDGVFVGAPTTPAFTDPDRAHHTEYRYSVVALDAAGNISAAAPAVSTYVS